VSRFLRAVNGRPVDCTPVWFMRQAGRYMPAYRKLREKHTLLDICRHPELACEVTMQPLQRFNFDAGIIFADILLPLQPMGVPFDFAQGEGPVIERPVRTSADVDGLRSEEIYADLAFVMDAIKLVCAELKGRLPLIGFAGAPFTLASYMIEGGGSRHYLRTKTMMYSEPHLWHRLMEKLSRVVGELLLAQHRAGAAVVQLFDSWVGCLSPGDYREFVLPHVTRIFDMLGSVPSIHFGTGNAELLPLMKQAGGRVIGLDWRIDLDVGWERLGHDVGVQGNLDPLVLFAPPAVIEQRVSDILRRADGRPGHIFNLGHGILPDTPEEHVKFAVDAVHRLSAGVPSTSAEARLGGR
jgi:uroporphyrinogen decarboxylase